MTFINFCRLSTTIAFFSAIRYRFFCHTGFAIFILFTLLSCGTKTSTDSVSETSASSGSVSETSASGGSVSGGGSSTSVGTATSTKQLTSDSHFGFLGNYYGLVGTEEGEKSWYYSLTNLAYFEPFSELGIKYDRPHPGPFVWETIERVQGVYDFTIPDDYVRRTQERDINIVATIWPFASWDQNSYDAIKCLGSRWGLDVPLMRCKPLDMTSYIKFIRELVDRYNGDGKNDMPGLTKPIKYWEILNEPETAYQSDKTGVQPMVFFRGNQTDYSDLFSATAMAIKETDPEAQILNGGTTTISSITTYWDFIMSINASNINIGSWHYDPAYDNLGDAGAKVWSTFFNNYGISKSWMTEFRVFNNTINSCSDEDCQAKKLVRSYVKAFNNGTGKIFYTYYIMEHDGLVSPDGLRKRQAFYALRGLINKLDYFSSVTTAYLHDDANYFAYKFIVDNKAVYVLWSAQDNSTVSFMLDNTSASTVKVTTSVPADNSSITLESTTLNVDNSSVSITLSSTPVYIEE
ncbi:MAG: glycoside hydrolase family 44 protein [Nitrospirae bacterium YQR-1]